MRFVPVVVLAVAVSVVVGSPISAAAALPTQQVLIELARQTLENEFTVLAGREAPALIEQVDEYGIRRTGDDRRTRTQQRRLFDAQYGLHFISIELELLPIGITSESPTTLLLRAEERSAYHFVNATHEHVADRDITRNRVEHTFRATSSGGRWTIVEDVIPSVYAPPQLTTREGPFTAIRGTAQSAIRSGRFGMPAPARAGYYDWQAAAYYADQNAYGHNASYRNWHPNDCTNFVSQALYAGGWQFRQDPYWDWFYAAGGQSMSWINAAAMKNFLANTGRATFLAYFEDLLIGDVLSADWGDNGAGVDHQMIVDDRLGAYLSGIYVDYHDTDRNHRSIADLLFEKPTSSNYYYAWHITGTY